MPEKEWNFGYYHVVLDKFLEHSLSTLRSAHILSTLRYIKLHTMVKQGHNKPFRKGGAKVTCISMQHVGGSEDMLPSLPPPLLKIFFKLHTQSSFLKPVISSVIVGKQNFGNYYTDRRSCIS